MKYVPFNGSRNYEEAKEEFPRFIEGYTKNTSARFNGLLLAVLART